MSALYVPRPDAYQMSETVQWTTLIIAAGVVIAALIGFKTLWDEWNAAWSIEDAQAEIAEFTDDLMRDRDQHADDVRESMGARWTA